MSLENDFKRVGIIKIQNFTYKGTYVVASLSNFLSEQSYNRGSKKWTKAEYVVLDTSFSGPDQKQLVLEAWRKITKYNDQYLIVPVATGVFTAYNYAGVRLGEGSLSDLFTMVKQ